MKNIKLILWVICCFVYHESRSQVPAIKDKWNSLIADLERRVDLTNHLVNLLSKAGFKDATILKSAKLAANELHSYLDTLHFGDSVLVAKAVKKNKQLTTALSKVFVKMERYPRIRSNSDVMNFIMQLEGTENRIAFSIKNYNETCSKLKRYDLHFTGESDTAPEVKF